MTNPMSDDLREAVVAIIMNGRHGAAASAMADAILALMQKRDQWQPIETAPRDGTPVMITDGLRFAAGASFDFTEPDELGYDNRPIMADTRRPNPDAGTIRLLWHAIGCSAWSRETDVYDRDHSDTVSILEPTHWRPLPPPPAPQGED